MADQLPFQTYSNLPSVSTPGIRFFRRAIPIGGTMCLASLVYPAQVQLIPTPETKASSRFHLRLLYGEGQDWQHALSVHIPPDVVPFFSVNNVAGLSIKHLPENSAAAVALPAHPQYVVLGVELKDGRKISCVPSALRNAFRARLSLAGLSLVMCSLSVSYALPLGVAVMAAFATHYFKSALDIPRFPAW